MDREKQDRHVLVIGGAGYIGSVLVARLLSSGYRVRVLDAFLYNNSSSIEDLFKYKDFACVQGDFCDPGTTAESLEGISDVVLLASLVGDPICKKHPDAARRINQAGAIGLFDLLRDRKIDRFVFLSTCSNYGLKEGDELADEEASLNPQSLYAETKVAVERHILENKDNGDFSPVILRLATAFGLSRRMRFDLTISEFTRELAQGRNLLVYDENTWRPYCHVDDISSAIIRSLEYPAHKVRGQVYNVGSNAGNHTKKMIAEKIQEIAGGGRVSYKEGGFDPRNYRVSFDKIAANLDFKSSFTVERSIDILVRAIRSGFFAHVEERGSFYGNYSIGEF